MSNTSDTKPLFITEHGGRLFKVLGGYTVELPDGSKVIMNPEAVIDAPTTESPTKETTQESKDA